MQPMMVAWPRSGMAPMTLYCGPGPERMLSGVVAAATIAAEAGIDTDGRRRKGGGEQRVLDAHSRCSML